MRGRRAGGAGAGVRGAAALVVALGLAGCGSEPAPDGSDAPAVADGAVVAVPADGGAPSAALDVGGPDLSERCMNGDLPIPVDTATSSISCSDVPDGPDTDLAAIVGPVWSDVDFEPGTYWVVLVCSGPGGYSFGSTTPGLAAEVTVDCDPDGRAVRQELGTVTEASAGVVTGGPTADGVTYVTWLVREGKTSL